MTNPTKTAIAIDGTDVSEFDVVESDVDGSWVHTRCAVKAHEPIRHGVFVEEWDEDEECGICRRPFA